MKKLLCVLAMLALCTSSAAAQRKLNERYAIVPNGFVRIFSITGSVTVVGWEKDSLAVTGTVVEPPGDRFAIGISPKGAKMGIWTDLETALKPSHITVHVPLRSQVWVKTTSANIRVSGVQGGVDLFSVSGSIEVAGNPREVYAETMGGSVDLKASATTARIKTAAGTIRASGNVSDLTAVTVSGAIEVSALSFQRARIESVDGDIRYSGAFPSGSQLELTNHAGLLALSLPAKANADFSVSLYSGEFVDEFGIGRKLVNPDKMKAREVTFTLGERPNARVTLRSFKGRVLLQRLP